MDSVLTEGQARQVWRILVEECQASAVHFDEMAFVIEFSRPSSFPGAREWRFQGCLGFGGKFRFPALSVDCYPEDSNPEREAALTRANLRLAELKRTFGLV